MQGGGWHWGTQEEAGFYPPNLPFLSPRPPCSFIHLFTKITVMKADCAAVYHRPIDVDGAHLKVQVTALWGKGPDGSQKHDLY